LCRQEDATLLPLGSSSMPEVAFAHFHNKFGSKAIVDDYIGSLNNTLLQFEKVCGTPSPLPSLSVLSSEDGVA